jgi:hypothetical protein
MDLEIQRWLREVLSEFEALLHPLQRVVDDPRALYHVLHRLGWELPALLGKGSAPLVTALAQVSTKLSEAKLAAEQADVPQAIAAADTALQAAYTALHGFRAQLLAGTVPDLPNEIAIELSRDLVDLLCVEYLRERWPTLAQVAGFFGLITEEIATPLHHGEGPARIQLRFPVRRRCTRLATWLRMAADPLGGLLTDAGQGLEATALGLGRRFHVLAARLGTWTFEGLTLTVTPSSLSLSGPELPLLSAGHGGFQAPLPLEHAPVLHVSSQEFKLTWTPPPAAVGGEPLFSLGGIRLLAVGANPADGTPTGIALTRTTTGVSLIARGGLRVELPADVVLPVEGGSLSAQAFGQLTLTPTAPPVLGLDEASMQATALTLGGGLRIEEATLKLGATSMPLLGGAPAPPPVSVSGRMTFGGVGTAQVRATLGPSGLSVESTGTVDLGGGLRLHPLGDTPILSATLAPGASTSAFEFTLAGGLDLPRGSGIQRVQLSGSLRLTASANGTLSVEQAHAQSTVEAEWALPGGLTLTGATAALTFSGGLFRARLQGGVRLDAALPLSGASGSAQLSAELSFEPANPQRIRIAGSVEHVDATLNSHLRIIDTTLRVAVQTAPTAHEAPFQATLEHGTAGLFLREGAPASPAATDFLLSVHDVTVTFTPRSTGFDLDFASGELRLPPLFTSATTASPPSVSLTPSSGLRIAVRPGAAVPVSLEGALLFQNFRATLPGTEVIAGFEAALQRAELRFRGADVPRLAGLQGSLRLPLPEDRVLALGFGMTGNAEWALDGLPPPAFEVHLDEDALIDLGADLSLALLGATASDPAYRTRFSVSRDAGTGRPRFVFTGGAELTLPLSFVTEAEGDHVKARAGATLTYVPGEPPILSGLTVEIRPRAHFRLGSDSGIVVRDAWLKASTLENLLDAAPHRPVTFEFSGEIFLSTNGADEGFGLRFEEARFTHYGASQAPDFTFSGLAVNTSGLRVVDGIPLRVIDPSLKLTNRDLPLSERFKPGNVKLGLSLEVGLAVAEGVPSVSAVSRGIEVTFASNGLPNRLSMRGLGMGIQNMDLGVMNVDAFVYVGGLPQPGQPVDPTALFFAGKGGGKVYGAGAKVLLAFGRPDRSGVAIDVSAGPSGIVLGQTGFVITGAAGGISLANSNADPTDIATYIGADGRPVEGQLPPPRTLPADEASPSASALPPEEPGFRCPGAECPPASVNIFCQRHPDTLERVILKFSSLQRTDLVRLGIREDVVNQLPSAPSGEQLGALAGDLVRKVRTDVLARWVSPPESVRRRLESLEGSMISWVTDRLREQLPTATRPFDALAAVARMGLPCPDVTLQITGTGSHLAVSSFLTVTGGFRLSTAGSVGVIGSVNLFGIPVGKLWGFITATDNLGNPSVSMCGVIKASVGPLELGNLRLSYSCNNCITGFATSVRQFATRLGAPLVREVLGHVAPAVLARASSTDTNADLLAQLTEAEARAFLAGLQARPLTSEIAEALKVLVTDLWNQFNPEILLCGMVQPRFFGMPLMPEVVAVRGHLTKMEYAYSIAFAPSAILSLLLDPRYFPPFDRASIGYRVQFPQAIAIDFFLNRGRTGLFHDAAAREQFAEEVFREFLETATVAGSYRVAPFGIELLNAEMRLLMPDLVDHPERNPGTWRTPEERGLVSRQELLSTALSDRIGNPLWRGTSEQLQSLFPNRPTGGLSLSQYFPHGGLIGGARMPVPRLLNDAPDFALLGTITHQSTPLVTRCLKVLEFIDRYLAAAPETQGTLSFHVPAPTPPFFEGTRTLTRREMVQRMAALNLPLDQLFSSPSYPYSRAFFRGKLRGQLLGIPTVEADVVAQPVEAGSRLGGYLEVQARVPTGSWLEPLVATASLNFSVRKSPSSRRLDESLAKVRAQAAPLSQGAPTEAQVATVITELTRALVEDAPKVSLEARVALRIPTVGGLDRLLSTPVAGVNASLHAYSLHYAPTESGTGPVAETRRLGGIALRADMLRMGQNAGLDISVASAELSLTQGPGGVPVVRGRFTGLPVGLPGGTPLAGGTVTLNSQPSTGQPYLTGEATSATGFTLAGLGLEPEGTPIRVAFDVLPGLTTTGPLELRLGISPSRLRLGGLSTTDSVVRIHGATSTAPFTLSTLRAWTATVSLTGLTLVDPAGRKVLRVGTTGQALTGRVDGVGLSSASLTVDVPEGVTATVFPDTPQALILGRPPGTTGPLRVVVRTNGTFEVQGGISPLSLGVFTVHGPAGTSDPIRATLTESAFTLVPGARLTMGGTTGTVTLAGFILYSTGNFTASITAGSLSLPAANHFQATLASGELVRTSGVTTLRARNASVSLFAAPYAVGLTAALLEIASNGCFTYDSGARTLTVPNLLEVSGRLVFGLRQPTVLSPMPFSSPLSPSLMVGTASTSGAVLSTGSTLSLAPVPFARLEGATAKLLPLGLTLLTAPEVTLSSTQLSGRVSSAVFGLTSACELLPETFSHTNGSGSLALAGSVRALAGRLTGRASFTAAGTTWQTTATLNATTTPLISTAAAHVTVGTSALTLSRDATGYQGRLAVSATVLGTGFSLTGRIASDGSVTLTLASSPAIPLGPFRLAAQGTLYFRPGDATSVSLRITQGTVTSPVVPDWYCDAVTFTTGGSGDFTFRPSGVRFCGMSFGSALELKRSGGTVTASSQDSVSVLGCTMTRSTAISSAGSVSGRLTGSFRVQMSLQPPTVDPPPPFPGAPNPPPYTPPAFTTEVDFGSVEIPYDASARRFVANLQVTNRTYNGFFFPSISYTVRWP